MQTNIPAPVVKTSDTAKPLLDDETRSRDDEIRLKVTSPISSSELISVLLTQPTPPPTRSITNSSSLSMAVVVGPSTAPTPPSRTAFYLALGACIIAGSLTALGAVEFSRAGTDIDHYIVNLSEEHAETICGVGIGAGGISFLMSSAYMIWNCVKSRHIQHQIDQDAENHRSGSFKVLPEEYLAA
ncbi:MAG: hypothetical protein Q7V63_03760 [Gammaproteobacteria bacterium]|nr:hypothetical protein [Gammaproteobacteria bacterium]